MEEPYQELSFAKLVKDTKGNPIEEERYAIFHQTYNQGKMFDPGSIVVEASLDYLTGYLEALLTSTCNQEVQIFNGISHTVRKGWYPKCEFEPLGEEELEKLYDNLFETKKRRLEKCLNETKIII